MKTTIKIEAGKSIVVEPNKTGAGVRFSLVLFGASMASAVLTADQCGALITGIQFANERSQQNGVRCHGDACCSGQIACPTPDACRVAA
jgi:hypothetical protein